MSHRSRGHLCLLSDLLTYRPGMFAWSPVNDLDLLHLTYLLTICIRTHQHCKNLFIITCRNDISLSLPEMIQLKFAFLFLLQKEKTHS